MKKVTLNVEGQDRTALVEKVGSSLWVHLNGQMYSYEPQRRSSHSAESTTDPTLTLAPMPGKVTKILVAKGDQVKKDQSMIVMEAMKMEYTLKCQMDGEVAELNVSVDDQVELGKLLVRVSGSNE